MEIVVDKGNIDYINVYEGDDIQAIVKAFANKHELSPIKMDKLRLVV